MKRRLAVRAAIPACALLACTAAAWAEVYAELGPDGTYVGMTTAVARGAGARIWEPVGAAERTGLVLNPDGDARGDGRPDFATDPLTGFPRAVWAMREGPDFEIVTSAFDGESWSEPVKVFTAPGADDLDPRIVFRPDGLTVVVWWQKGPAVVRAVWAARDGVWRGGDVISSAGVRARKPALRQEGLMTIVAYRTPRDIGIVTLSLSVVSPRFGDGPTPFPPDEYGGEGEPAPGDNFNPPVSDR